MRKAAPQIAGFAVVLAAPALLYLALKLSPGFDESAPARPDEHFWIVSSVALMSTALAFCAAVAALRSESTRQLFVAMAFLSLAGFFSVHGLATPGFFLEFDHVVVVGFAARVAVVMAGLFLALSSLTLPPSVAAVIARRRRVILGGWLCVLAGFGLAGLQYPDSVPPRIMDDETFLDGTLVITLLCCSVATASYGQRFILSRLPVYGALLVGSVFIAEAQISMHFSPTWSYSWWLYHFVLLAALTVVVWSLFVEYARGRSPVDAVGALALDGSLAQIRAGQTEVLKVLASAIEAKDGYLHGHGARVSALAVAMGETLRLPSGKLRNIAQGGFLHDIGKIAIPDSILHKPGRLTNDEYELIKTHSARGEAILKDGGLSEMELAIIRHHHERFDGRGYPDGVAGAELPIEVRIVSVADVYDSLRSHRSYRPPMSRLQAMRIIDAETGTHFDPRMVEVFLDVVDGWEREYAHLIPKIEAPLTLRPRAA